MAYCKASLFIIGTDFHANVNFIKAHPRRNLLMDYIALIIASVSRSISISSFFVST